MQINNRQIACIRRRALYRNALAPLNIAYTKLGNGYDFSLESIQNPLLNFIAYPNSTIIDSHLYFINDPLSFSQEPSGFSFYVPKILFFHDDALLSMKKEDLYLLNQKIHRYKKYTFIPKIKNIIPDINIIRYGFNRVDHSALLRKNKNILFISEEKNIDKIIFSQIKQHHPDADILSLRSNNTNIDNILLNYKVCINLNSNYNTLLSASKGCITISSSQEPDIPHHYMIKETKEILQCLNHIQNNFDSNIHIINHDTITTKYEYSSFISIIQNIIEEQLNIESFYE